MNHLKKGMISLALTGSFILGVGASSTADAQDWRWERQRRIEQQRRDGNYGPVDRNGNIDRNRNGIDDRYEAYGQVDINQNGIPDSQENYGRYGRNRGYYGNDGYYGNRGNYGYGGNDGYYGNRGNYGYGVNNAEFQKGYRDGLDRGRKDAQTNRAMDPNNSSHYRNGNTSYRAGFERGFYQAFRQYSYRGR
jgi:hypothetical protein